MNLSIPETRFPGTVILRDQMRGIEGEEFLDKVFFLTDGVMLSRIKEVSGVDGTTLQNWVKRGWIGNTVNKRYSKNQLARILIINMLRGSLQLETIDFLLRYINGTINDESDDIIPESTLYGYICRCLDRVAGIDAPTVTDLEDAVKDTVKDYTEFVPGAKTRLETAMVILLAAYYASLARGLAVERLKTILPL